MKVSKNQIIIFGAVLLVVFGLMFFVKPVSAAGFAGLGIPFWAPNGLVACDGNVCNNLCQLVDLAQNLIRFGFTILFMVIAPIMLAIGGGMILISGASETRLAQGKKILKGAVIGIVIAMLSYAIVATFLWLIGNKGGGQGVSWPDIQCAVPPPPGTLSFGVGGAPGEVGGGGGPTSSHEAIFNELTGAGITITTTGGSEYVRSSCDGVLGPCTTLDRLGRAAVDGLLQIKGECGCNLVVTAGTEPGHQTHGPGKAIVDLDNNESTDSYILGKIGNYRPELWVWYRSGSYYFRLEDNPRGSGGAIHWHVCFNLVDCRDAGG